MKLSSFRIFSMLGALACSSMLSAQSLATFSNYGVVPDAYIDLSAIPSAIHAIGVGTPAITLTLPVQGTNGNTVTVSIPAMGAGIGTSNYTTTNGIFKAYGVRQSTDPTIKLKFSKPIFGISAEASTSGRYFIGFTMVANNDTMPKGSEPPAPGVLTFTNEAPDVNGETTAHLQMRSSNSYSGISTILIQMPSEVPSGAILSNLRVQSTFSQPQAVLPKNGLQLWFNGTYADNGSGVFGNVDQSGNGRDATADPANPSYSSFNLPIAGWSQMTIFLVARNNLDQVGGTYGSESAGVFFNENQSWGNTYVSPFQTHETFRFGTTQVGNYPNYVRPTTIGQDYTISRAVHNNTTDSLCVNGLLVLQQAGKQSTLQGTDGTAFLNRGYNNTYFNGAIGDVIIYDRVLTADETALIESYLRQKFGIR